MKRKLLQAGAVTIRPGLHMLENGKVTKRFDHLANDLIERRAALYRELAK